MALQGEKWIDDTTFLEIDRMREGGEGMKVAHARHRQEERPGTGG